MLLDAGADVNVKGKDYMAFTPRTAASTSNCPQDVSNILEAAGGMLQELHKNKGPESIVLSYSDIMLAEDDICPSI